MNYHVCAPRTVHQIQYCVILNMFKTIKHNIIHNLLTVLKCFIWLCEIFCITDIKVHYNEEVPGVKFTIGFRAVKKHRLMAGNMEFCIIFCTFQFKITVLACSETQI